MVSLLTPLDDLVVALLSDVTLVSMTLEACRKTGRAPNPVLVEQIEQLERSAVSLRATRDRIRVALRGDE